MGKFKYYIESTICTTSKLLVEYYTEATEPSTNGDLSIDSTDMLDDLYDEATKDNIYLDDIMVSASHARRPKGIDAFHLSKIWRIYLDSAKQTLEVTSQHSTRSDNPTLYHNFGTNNRILRYKRIKEHLLMYTFFSTNTTEKSSRGNTFCQLFVTDKSFV